MKLKATNSGGDFELPPPSTYSAVLTRWIDKGTQDGGQWGPKRKVMLGFEINEKRDDGLPFMVFANYTASLHKKASLRRDLEAWRGRQFHDDEEFDPRNALGKPAMINVVHSEDGQYANIASIMPLPKGLEAPQPVGELLYFDPDDPDISVLDHIGQNLRARIEASPEYQKAMNGPGTPPAVTSPEGAYTEADADFNDPIPF